MTTTMQQIIDFTLELEKLKGITRKSRPLGLDRYGLADGFGVSQKLAAA